MTYIQKQLMKQGVVLAKTPMGMAREAFKERVSQVKLYEDYSLGAAFNLTHRLTPEIIATAALWSEQHGQVPIVMGDIPLDLFKYNLINTVPLGELEAVFEKVAFRSFMDDVSMMEAALIECPDIMLGLSDEYMASLLNRLSENHSNIVTVCGYGQTRSIPHYLRFSKQANSPNSVQEVARHREVYQNIVRKDNPEMQVDKLAIIDQLLFSTAAKPVANKMPKSS